ncbi:folate family ECF transporter S component [Clostridiisalibacter paucivorans]|uniref:folate family ECF transporter S component n=1 Tax=Clostridiisalibacter paucivorans TaxID=408753 RepID=UPI00068656D3|nr:folate family ECF transporter S component [Clostridiisalibacter paucivorans]
MISESNKKQVLSTKYLVGSSLLTGISIILTRFFSVIVPLVGLPALRIGFGSIPIMISGILFGPIAGGLTGIVADLLGVIINPQGAFFPGFTLSAALTGIIPGVLVKMFENRLFRRFKFTIINGLTISTFIIMVFGILLSNGILKFNNSIILFYDNIVSNKLFFLVILLVLTMVILPFFISKRNKLDYSKEGYPLDKIIFIQSLTYIIVSLGLNTFWLAMMFNKGYMIFLPGRILAGLIVIPLHSTIIYTISKFFKYIKD